MKTTENQRLKLLRETLGLTQEQFHEITGVSQSTIAKIELGVNELTSKSVQKIVTAIPVRAEWLTSDEGNIFVDGTEVQALKRSLHEGTFNTEITYSEPWRDALVSQLREENSSLKQQVATLTDQLGSMVDQVKSMTQAILNLTAPKQPSKKQPNFPKASGYAPALYLPGFGFLKADSGVGTTKLV